METIRTQARTHVDRGSDFCLWGLFAVGVAYLWFKVIQVSGHAGYDFRYSWLAGTVWSQGLNPYSEDFTRLGSQFITEGHMPIMWLYPPNWALPSLLLARMDLTTAAVVFNVFNVFALLLSSWLLTETLYRVEAQKTSEGRFARVFAHLWTRRNAFFLHVFAMAGLQATAIVLSVGQYAILIYLGLSLLIVGLGSDRRWAATIGLTVLLLKPQIAAGFAVVLLLERRHWGLVGRAIGLSAVLALPAFIVAPTAAADWLENIGAFENIVTNTPFMTTGVRSQIWNLLNYDIGGTMGLAATIMFVVLLGTWARRTPSNTPQVLAAAGTIVVAFAPLHTYDHVIVGVALFAIMQGGLLEKSLGLSGALLLWRADDLAMITGLHNPGVQYFLGSPIATLGGTLMAAAICLGALAERDGQRRRHAYSSSS